MIPSRFQFSTSVPEPVEGTTFNYKSFWDVVKLPLHTLPFLQGAKAFEKYNFNTVQLAFLHGAGAPCHPGEQQCLMIFVIIFNFAISIGRMQYTPTLVI